MSKSWVLTCGDGAVVSAEDADEFVIRLEAHLRDVHPELAGRLSRDEILAMAREDTHSL